MRRPVSDPLAAFVEQHYAPDIRRGAYLNLQARGFTPPAAAPPAPLERLGGRYELLTDAQNLAGRNPGFSVRQAGAGGYVVARGGRTPSAGSRRRMRARERENLRDLRGFGPNVPGGGGTTILPG